MIQGIIFDFDGTLFDSMYVWDNIIENYLISLGKQPQSDLTRVLESMSVQQGAEYLRVRYRIPQTPEGILRDINHTVERAYFHDVRPKPGVTDWLEQLGRRGVKLCIATATDRYMVEAALARCDLARCFSAIFTCGEVGSGKDSPEIFQRALAHLGTERAHTLVAEDAWYAIQTAKQAGFPVLGIFDSHERRQREIQESADLYLTDYLDMEKFWRFAQEV